ncbi:uncharacterized protein [Nicotiana tomentosiformis]|uniref:uncharacterized protein n=1 Tax=Nicotiana tomentosiformis TaxID=4098 RepID=UPI00388CCC30
MAENPVDEEYEPLKTYFPDKEVMYVDEADHDEKPGWKLFFDGAANMKGVGIGVVLIFETRHHYPVTAQLRFYCTNNMAEYEACILGLRLAIDMGVQEILVLGDSDLSVEFKHIPRIHNEIADALATLASMLHHPDKTYVEPLHIQICDQHAYCNVVDEELDDNAANLNSHLMKEVCQQFKIMHRNSTLYRPKANGAVEAVNKNINKILCKMAVIPAEVEIPFLRIVAEAEIDDDEWVKTRLEQLSLIDEKRLAAVCHGQLYQKRMARAYNKKVHPRKFEVGQLVLKRIIPHQAKAKGKFAPNWQGPFIVTKVLPNGALYLTDIEGMFKVGMVKGQEIFFALPGNTHEESMFQISSVLSFRDPLDNGI